MATEDPSAAPSRHRNIPKPWVSPQAKYTVLDWNELYRLPRDFDGTGQTIAILLPGGGMRLDDLDVYFRTLALARPSIEVIEVGEKSNSPCSTEDLARFLLSVGAGYQAEPRAPLSGSATTTRSFPPDMQPGSALFNRVTWTFEGVVDTEISCAAAPGASIRVYVSETTAGGIARAIDRATQDRVCAMVGSWGWPESSRSEEFVDIVNAALARAAEKGITCCFASGDSGSRPGFETGNNALEVFFPACSPNVLACGGTAIVEASHAGLIEAVWNEPDFTFDGASGGGFSRRYSRPAWQKIPEVEAFADSGRALPDVAGNAAASSGAWLWIAGLNAVSFGTSSASPFYAALVARVTQALGGTCRFMTPLIYRPDVRSTFGDVTRGNNVKRDLGPEYAAAPGWDPCTGWGSPRGDALLSALRGAFE